MHSYLRMLLNVESGGSFPDTKFPDKLEKLSPSSSTTSTSWPSPISKSDAKDDWLKPASSTSPSETSTTLPSCVQLYVIFPNVSHCIHQLVDRCSGHLPESYPVTPSSSGAPPGPHPHMQLGITSWSNPAVSSSYTIPVVAPGKTVLCGGWPNTSSWWLFPWCREIRAHLIYIAKKKKKKKKMQGGELL